MGSVTTFVLDNPKAFELMTKDIKDKVSKAAIDTVNKQVWYAKGQLEEKTESTFITRNKFTVKSIKYDQMRKKPIRSLNEVQAKVGFLERADYMARQDKGGMHTSKTGSRLAIPTDKARKRKSGHNVVAGRYRIDTVLQKKIRGPYTNKIVLRSTSKKARAVARAYVASGKNKDGNKGKGEKKFVHYGKDLFQINRFQKKGNHISFDKVKIYVMDKKATRTPKKDFFLPTCEEPMKNIQIVFNSEMDKYFG